MKKFFLLIAVAFTFYSCKKNEIVLEWPEEKTVAVLADLRIIDAQVKKHLSPSRDSVQDHFKEILLKAHNITDEELTNHILLIQSSPKLAADLEKKVNQILEKRLDVIKGKSSK